MNDIKMKSLKEALSVSPGNIPLLKLYAQACVEAWSFPEARDTFNRILKLDPHDAEAQVGLASILFQTGQVSEASVRVEAVLQKHPQSVEAHLLNSRLQLSEGHRDEARAAYEKAKAIDPNLQDGALEREFGVSPSGGQAKGQARAVQTSQGWVTEQYDEEDTDDFEEDDFEVDISGVTDSERPKISFAHVGGMDGIKEDIRMKIIHPLSNPDLFKAYGKKLGGGVLLYGPPGCGKTYISRATAGEIQSNFLSIGLHQILDMYIGNSEKNLHAIFQWARQNQPCVLFIDEIDALAADRKDFKQSAARTLINQFLAELDGESGANEGVLILGATNAPWHIDPAFRRPGRFDRIIFVPPPDDTARTEIIKLMAKDKPVDRLDINAIVKRTKGYSGADIKALFDCAVEKSLAKAMVQNRVIPLSTADLIGALKAVKPSTQAWFESAKNYALYANQSGLYDPIADYLGLRQK